MLNINLVDSTESSMSHKTEILINNFKTDRMQTYMYDNQEPKCINAYHLF